MLFLLLASIISAEFLNNKFNNLSDLKDKGKRIAKQKLRNLKRKLLGKKPLVFDPVTGEIIKREQPVVVEEPVVVQEPIVAAPPVAAPPLFSNPSYRTSSFSTYSAAPRVSTTRRVVRRSSSGFTY